MQRSDNIGALAAALAKAQAALKPAAKDATNPHFKSRYADLAAVMEACRVPLTANGLAVSQSAEAQDARVTITTLLLHSSGEWLSSALTLTARDASPQSVGSAISYGRRYGLSCVVGVTADDDDDAEAAQPSRSHQASPPQERGATTAHGVAPGTHTTKASDARVISEAQRKRLYAISKTKEWTQADMTALLVQYGYASSKDIRIADYDRIVKVIETGALDEAEPDHAAVPVPDYSEDEGVPF